MKARSENDRKTLIVLKTMTRHLFALSLLGLSFALNPSFAAAQETLRPLAEALLDVQADAGALETRIETERFAALKSLPENTPIRMTGLNAKWRLPFVIARDELATKASVTFKWTPSPVLLPVKSQLNLRLNGELERSLPITTEEIGRTVVTTVELNPKRLKDLNELEFEFVGSYEHNCESPADASLWLEIDRESTLTLSKQKIRVANELQLLPSPFLDPGARSRLTLPVLFPVRPSDKTLQAAAVLASRREKRPTGAISPCRCTTARRPPMGTSSSLQRPKPSPTSCGARPKSPDRKYASRTRLIPTGPRSSSSPAATTKSSSRPRRRSRSKATASRVRAFS